MGITARTKLCALLGDPVEHSFSPLIHNAAFAQKGLDFAYVAFRVEQSRIESAVKGIRALNIRGASITIPHKVSVVRYVDHLEPVAKQIGSINTIVNDKGTLKGYNSDGTGALKAFQDRDMDLDGKTVLVLGSGGAARAITFTLGMKAPIKELFIAGILEKEVFALSGDLQKVTNITVRADILEDRFFETHALAADVLINCTPVGMYPDIGSSPVPSDFLQRNMAIFDVVYNPPKTKLLRDAERAGCTTISGLEMFINQAVVQFELWTGEKAPEEVMRKVIVENIGQKVPK